MAQYFQVHATHPQPRLIRQAAEIMRRGGLIAYPTDSCYALGGRIGDAKALERLRRVRRLDERIKEFMEFSHEQRLELKAVDLGGFLQEVADVWQPVAAERGIRLHEEKKEAPLGGAGSVLQLALHTSERGIGASGAVLHGHSPRLLHLDGIDIEAPLQGTLLTFRNQDVPGVIGRIGTILGAHKVNITNFALGRSNGGGPEPATALAVLQIDGEVNETVLKELRSEPAVTGVRQVTL